MAPIKLNGPTEALISRIKSGIAASIGGGAEGSDGSGWAFGSKPSISSASFTPAPASLLKIDSSGIRGLNGFWDTYAGSQVIVVNMSSTTINSYGQIRPGVMRVHPASAGPDLTMRYVAAIDGDYQLAGSFTDTDPGGGDGVGLIITQNTPLGGYPTYYLEYYLNNGDSATFDVIVPLKAGEFLDLSLDRRGGWDYDSTNFEFTTFQRLDSAGSSPTSPPNSPSTGASGGGQQPGSSPQPTGPVTYYSFNDAIATEGETVSMVITRTGDLTTDATVTFAPKTTTSSAIAGLDYLLLANSVTFNAGSSSTTVPVSLVEDTTYEPDKILQVEGLLITPQVAGNGSHLWSKNTANILIKDNDKKLLPASTVTKALIKGNLVTLQFSSSLNSTKPEAKLFSVLAGSEMIDVIKTSITPVSGNVTLELSRAASPGEMITLSYSDLSGDQIDGVIENTDGTDVATISLKLDNLTLDEFAPTLDSAVADGNLVDLAFNEELSPTVPALSRFSITQNNLKLPIKSAEINASNGQLRLMLAKPVAPKVPVLLSYTDLDGNQPLGVLQDKAGNDLQTFSNVPIENQSLVSQSPLKLDAAEVDGKLLTLNFDRELDPAIASTRFFNVLVNGKAVKVVLSNTVVADRQVALTLDKSVTPTDKLTISYSDAAGDQTKGVVQDSEGNDLESFTQIPVKNITQKQSILAIETSEISGKTVRLLMSEPLSSSSLSSSRFEITANGKKQTITSIQSTPQDGIVSINLEKSIDSTSLVKFSYSDPIGDQATGVIQDADGNDLNSVKDLLITNFTADDDPPILLDAAIEGKEVTLSFDEIIAGGPIANSRLTVKADGKRIKLVSARGIESDTTVILTLAAFPSESGVITISYSDPKGNQTAGVIQDSAGNDLATLRDFVVDATPVLA